jgi:peptidyl-prolyl cis-trans isomerase SDCCAG10
MLYLIIDIELWPKEAPLACRNFIQLSLEGYYDNTIVHRVIKNFMVQMGDPTGTGEGGESIWGRPFKDEIHQRIKFNHRGQVAMANANKPHSNTSQFFISLDNCDWLHGKHTIFGKVTGNTMFNVLRMGEVETGEKDRPMEMIRIMKIEVLHNPFDDIIPR